MFLSVIKRTAREKCLLDKNRPVIVGVSGGADSLALMDGLHRLGYPMAVAHLDHALRPDSAADADFVRAKAVELGVPFVTERVDVREVAAKEKLSIEEAARNVRYAFLFEQARLSNAQAVAVAHHADDQVETVLMHFIRGAALSGLSGMPFRRVMPVWDAEIPLVRPLLELWREDIEAYITEIGWTPREDLSNADTTYFRNHLRHELIPQLVETNPRFKEGILRMADVLGEEDRLLVSMADAAWESCFIENSQDRVVLNLRTFIKLEKGLQRRLLRRAVALLRPDLRDIGFEVVERGLDFIADPSASRQIDLAAQLNLVVLGDRLIVKPWSAALPDDDWPLLPDPDFQAQLMPGESVALANGWALTLADRELNPEVDFEDMKQLTADEAWLDAKDILLPLVVRGQEAGENWQPLGMVGHSQKMSDFFVNEKVAQHLRSRWPLVCTQWGVAWVAGLRPAEPYKVQPDTRRIMCLRLIRTEP